jgi:hypothetical protein
MKIIAFAGPSIERATLETLTGVECRPPVSQGDVFRAAQTSPNVIAIIDGYFEGVPSVWHKEILWAMAQGIEVYGASSMGALRAAELHPFGMHGVGEIFNAYRDGVYEDDDEVAVLHGPVEMDYRPLSLPMVNARATIQAAVTSEVIHSNFAAELITIGKAIFYQERDWRAIFRQAAEQGLDADQIDKFEHWLPQGKCDVKRQDALTLLDTLAAISDEGDKTVAANFEFEWTVMWDRVFSGQTGQAPSQGISHVTSHSTDQNGAPQDNQDQAVLDELRLDPKRYLKTLQRSQLRRLALREAYRRRLPVDSAAVRQQLQSLREAERLYSRAELDQWIAHNDWTVSQLERALEESQLAEAARPDVDDAQLLDELRLDGDYIDLKSSAMRKQAREQLPLDREDPVPAQLLSWYFESLLGESIPAQLDDYLATVGIHSRDVFYRLLRAHHRDQLAINSQKQ